MPRTSRTCLLCCGSSRIPAAGRRVLRDALIARVLVLLPRCASSITWQRPPIRSSHFLPFSPRRAPATTWGTFVETTGNLRYTEWPSDLERARLWYEPHLDRIYDDAEVRRADLIQFEQIAGAQNCGSAMLTLGASVVIGIAIRPAHHLNLPLAGLEALIKQVLGATPRIPLSGPL